MLVQTAVRKAAIERLLNVKNKFNEDLFNHIKHGDEGHQKWLYDELYKFTKEYKMQIKIKKLNDQAVIPVYAKAGDAGLDFTATSKIAERKNTVYGTGLAIEIPEGYVGLLFPRSSLANKDLLLTNHVGLVDSGYRGEIMFKFKRLNNDRIFSEYNIGERIGQLLIIPYPKVELVEVKDLNESERGNGGFGSTGR
jgi:dUTP pyrophosphatase